MHLKLGITVIHICTDVFFARVW